MKKVLFLSLLFTSVFSWSQDTSYVDPNYDDRSSKKSKNKESIFKKMYVGGTFGLSFGTYTSFLIEPMVGLRLTKKLSTGVGIGYRYGRDNRSGFEYSNYIGRVFARYIVIPKLYTHVEYMVESYDVGFNFIDTPPGGNQERLLVPFLFVGGGFRQPTGRGSFIFQVLFNVLQDNKYSAQVYPSGQPYISLGYIGGF